MQISFTKKELQFIEITDDDEYRLKCKEDAPPKIKDSIQRKIEAHKRWLFSGGTK